MGYYDPTTAPMAVGGSAQSVIVRVEDLMEWGLFLVLALIVYICIGNFIANRYFFRRHGVRGRLGWYRNLSDIDAGTWDALWVSITWPLSMRRDSVQDPEPCTHQHHVLARDEARRRSGAVDDALRRERGSREAD